MLKSILTLLTATVLVAAPMAAHAQAAAPGDVVVQVSRDGNTFAVTTELTVAASVDEVWEVLVDFDKMATILSNVDESRITSRDGNRLEVAQKSHGNAGPIRINLDSVRQIELTPKREIKSRLLKGDLKSSDFSTRIAAEGETTRISVSGKFVTTFIGGTAVTPEAVQAQTQRQYQELREEILRRKNKQPTPACLLAKNCVRG